MTKPIAPDLSVVETKDGVRVHKTTCKRLPKTAVPFDSAVDFASGSLATAKAASCCKPKIQAAIGEVISTAAERRAASEAARKPKRARMAEEPKVVEPEPVQEALDTDLDTPESDPVEVAAAEVAADDVQPDQNENDEIGEGVNVVVDVTLDTVKGHRYLWPIYRTIAEPVAALYGVQAKVLNPTYSVALSGPEEDVLRVQQSLESIWDGAAKDLRQWRKDDETYKALPPMEKQWAKSERFAAEKEHLSAYLAMRVEASNLI